MSGCCADKACTPETCMALPAGVTCGQCVHILRCRGLFGCETTNNECDWFPRRFRPRTPAPRDPSTGGGT